MNPTYDFTDRVAFHRRHASGMGGRWQPRERPRHWHWKPVVNGHWNDLCWCPMWSRSQPR